MEIECELKVVEEGGLESLKGGNYLSVRTTYTKNTPVLISLKEFDDFYIKSIQKSIASPVEITVDYNSTQIMSIDNRNPDFKDMINFLVTKINIDTDVFTSENNEITVKSDSSRFLELPWENLIENNLFVIREIFSDHKIVGTDDNNLLLLMSHANEGIGEDLKKIMDEEIKSVYNSLHFFIEDNQNYFRINNILLSKHTTIGEIEKIIWHNFNFAHLVMHGDQNGNLCLENSDQTKYRSVDNYPFNKFIELIKDHCFKLIFLSMCYSGGGQSDQESPAFKIIKCGISKNVIAYSNKVGDISAKSFVDIFYKNLATPNHNNIKDVYKNSLIRYYEGGNKKYVPFLYSSI